MEGGLVQKTWQTEANLYLIDNFAGCPEPSMGSASLGELKCLLGIMVFTFSRCLTFRRILSKTVKYSELEGSASWLSLRGRLLDYPYRLWLVAWRGGDAMLWAGGGRGGG